MVILLSLDRTLKAHLIPIAGGWMWAVFPAVERLMFALCQTVGKESCLKPTPPLNLRPLSLGFFLPSACLYPILINFDLMFSLIILLSRLLKFLFRYRGSPGQQSVPDWGYRKHSCPGSFGGVSPWQSVSVLSQACVRQCAHDFCLARLLRVVQSRHQKAQWMEYKLLSEIGKEACDQLTRVAGKIGEFQSSTVAEAYLFWCRICTRITVNGFTWYGQLCHNISVARSDHF